MQFCYNAKCAILLRTRISLLQIAIPCCAIILKILKQLKEHSGLKNFARFSLKFLTDLMTHFTKFELSTTFRYQDMTKRFF